MHAPTMTALDFPRIQQELAAYTACQLGKELALNTRPLPSLEHIRTVQQETEEAKQILRAGRSVPFGGIQDVRPHVDRSLIGGVLRPEQLMAVADTIYGCRQLHRFLTEHKTDAPLLSRHAQAFGEFDDIEDEIRRCIDRGTVSSRASQQLKAIRGEIITLESRIQERLNGLLKQYRTYLQESLVTSRNGRYVIPVKASARASVPGTVHGASASGSTLFIEPEAVASLCGELESWRAMEEAEIEQILMMLSGQVAAHAMGLQATLGAVARLDLIFARARLSHAWDARPVEWNDTGVIDLKNARHPLLGKNAVGNRIRMGAGTRLLIVTGPNTGGKTLLLKTLGLLVIIARCGLHIPVDEGSTLHYFEDVCADIGDQQSLEQSLSTFSGHIKNVAPMLEHAGPHVLILLDELGSGTDPHEGTGLGIALLEAFLAKGAYTLCTTHLREIKEFGRRTPGCAFAGMGFDGETLKPTYHLIYGTLGESHALEIAARNGLQAAVVARARELVYGSAPAPGAAGATTPEATTMPGSALPAADEPATAAPIGTTAAAGPAAPTGPAASIAAEPPAPAAPRATVVAAVSPSRCRVACDGAEREINLPDPLRKLYPGGLVPGDRLRLRDGRPIEVSARRTVLISRDADTQAETVVAANPTGLLILMSAKQPDFHATVLARHLLYAERQGLTPVICLTKADLVGENTAQDWLKPFRTSGYQTLLVSATRARGIDDLKAVLKSQVTALMGPAGAGKTTLLAALLGAPAPDGALPHAVALPDDTWLIDMPGLRELGVWKPDLSGAFRDFVAYSPACARPGCLHRQEQGCAVRQAVEQGRLKRRRYEQYLQLLTQMRLA